MKLITETVQEVRYLKEAREDGGKAYYIEGPFLQTEIANRNGRIYRKPVMEREVNRYIKEYVETKRAFGELGHPDGCLLYTSPSPRDLSTSRMPSSA